MVVLRGASLAALMSFFGVLVFLVRVNLPPSVQALSLRRALQRLGSVSAVSAIVLGAAWFVLVTREIAGSDSVTETLSSLVPVAFDTQFGPWLLLRLGLVVAALLLAGSFRGIGLALAAAALALQPMLAHAGAIGGRIGLLLIGSEALHILAAGAWLGGLLPLAMTVASVAAPTAADVGRRFSGLALTAVLLLTASGLVQAEVLLGSPLALTGMPYGHVLALKLGLIAIALALAALNRFELIRRLVVSAGVRRWLPWTVGTESVVGLCIVLAAGWLASLAPTADANAPWSRWRVSVAAVAAVVAAIALAIAARSGSPRRATPPSLRTTTSRSSQEAS